MEASFEQHEDSLQKLYDKTKVNFKAKTVLRVTILRCRDVSVSKFWDKVDTPDPLVVVRCPKLPLHNKFKTTIQSNVTTCEINETFQFVLPENLSVSESFPLEIELRDSDILMDDVLGVQTYNVSDLKFEEVLDRTATFDSHGTVDIQITKTRRNSPDMRMAIGLSAEEKAFRKKRIPLVYKALQNILQEKSPKSVVETPVVSLVCSGGGYRAAVGMCGAMEAIQDAGLMDALTYACGLSGSAWYLSSAYAHKGMTPERQPSFHTHLRDKFQENVLSEFVNIDHHKKYGNYIKQKRKFGQPDSFVDFFGFTVGRKLLGDEKIETRLSDLQGYVDGASVPFPLFVSLHVRNTVAASKFHAYVEISPYEVNFPVYGIGLKPYMCGSAFNAGIMARKCPEQPLHFIQGMCGCAFSILLNVFIAKGGENCDTLLHHIDDIRLERQHEKADHDIEVDSDASGDSDDDDDVLASNRATEEEKAANSKAGVAPPQEMQSSQEPTNHPGLFKKMTNWMKALFHKPIPNHSNERTTSQNYTKASNTAEATKTPTGQSVFSAMKSLDVFTSRDALIGRTAKIFNVACGFDSLNVFSLNPNVNNETPKSNDKGCFFDQMKLTTSHKISVNKEVISVADAGILKNVPTDVALRPQRDADLLIVIDFNGYQSDTKFDYMPLVTAAAHSRMENLKFPKVDIEDVVTTWPAKDFFVLEGDEDAPTVLWFTLSNAKFRKLENYKPRFSKEFSCGTSFNDFPVFDPHNAYSTFKFQYSVEEFDRLRDLMYFTVSSHIEDIKQALAGAVERKRAKVARRLNVDAKSGTDYTDYK